MPKKAVDPVLFEQYKMAVASAETTSNRRADSNKFFLSINSIIVGGILFINEKVEHIDPRSVLLVAVFGIVVCLIWLLSITDYKKLNSAKFQIIHDIEKDLPVKFYTKEWKLLNKQKHWYAKYKTLSKLELFLPITFIVLYIVALVVIR